MADFFAQYPASSSGSSNDSIGVNGASAPTSSTQVAGENPSGNLQPLQTNASGDLLVEINTQTSGLATLTEQQTQTTKLNTIASATSSTDSTSTNIFDTLTDLNGKTTNVNTSNTIVTSSVLPTGAATETTLNGLKTKTASSDVTAPYDYRAFTYVSATQKIDTIVYKTGGSGGTTVATQTFGYDGSDRLTSITTT